MKYISFLLIFFTLNLYAKDDLVYKYFSFDHPTCNIWIYPENSPQWSHLGLEFKKEVIKKLRLKRFNVHFLKSNSPTQIKPGGLYLSLYKSILPEGFYKKCLVKFEMKVAKEKYIAKSDKTVFQKDSLRSLPRHTFKGEERCLYALKDTFGIIPYCKKNQ